MKWEWRSTPEARERSYRRRSLALFTGVCINGPLVGGAGKRGVIHGPVVRGGKCQHCLDTYKRSR